jgi:hypothetical protein
MENRLTAHTLWFGKAARRGGLFFCDVALGGLPPTDGGRVAAIIGIRSPAESVFTGGRW